MGDGFVLGALYVVLSDVVCVCFAVCGFATLRLRSMVWLQLACLLLLVNRINLHVLLDFLSAD